MSGTLGRLGAAQGLDLDKQDLALEDALTDLNDLLELAGALSDGAVDLTTPDSVVTREPELSISEARPQNFLPFSHQDNKLKREKTRERERRKYYRRKEKLGSLQYQVSLLEHQLQQLSSHPPTIADRIEIVGSDTLSVRPSSRDELKTRLVEVQVTQARLRSENTQLRRQFRDAALNADLLSELLKSEHKLYSAHSSYFRLLKPLSRQTCWELNREALKRMHAFETELLGVSAIGTFAGWRGKRYADGHLFKFGLDKTFHHVNPHLVMSGLWSNLVDPRKLEKMYSAAMAKRVRLIQKVDEDNYVFLDEMRSTDPGDKGALVKTAILFSRFTTKSGCRIHFLNLDRQQIEMEDRSTGEQVKLDDELWVSNEKLTWSELEVVGEGTIFNKFRGIFPTIGASAYYWMSEIVMMCLRAEVAGFGPRFRVPAS